MGFYTLSNEFHFQSGSKYDSPMMSLASNNLQGFFEEYPLNVNIVLKIERKSVI